MGKWFQMVRSYTATIPYLSFASFLSLSGWLRKGAADDGPGGFEKPSKIYYTTTIRLLYSYCTATIYYTVIEQLLYGYYTATIELLKKLQAQAQLLYTIQLLNSYSYYTLYSYYTATIQQLLYSY